MPIRQLPQTVINRIAAGEVIERPASVVKELAENAIDAGAHSIEIVVADGGLSLIRVTDDGCGMGADDLRLCIERHATSKLDAEDLTNIATLGFRGEALPSIGSVARLSIVSRPRDTANALEIQVDGGEIDEMRPAALRPGTRIEVRDLFYATPARLKFMKSERAENTAIGEVVKRLILARPDIGFSLMTGERAGLNAAAVDPGDAEALRHRLARVMGRDFAHEAAPFAFDRGDVGIHGFAGLPTLHRPDQNGQFLFVNGRPVKDRLIASAVRVAYGDLLPRGRHPLLVLFVTMPAHEVDVNVHPAKAEVRFRDGGLMRSVIIAGLRGVLDLAAVRTSRSLSGAALSALRGEVRSGGGSSGAVGWDAPARLRFDALGTGMYSLPGDAAADGGGAAYSTADGFAEDAAAFPSGRGGPAHTPNNPSAGHAETPPDRPLGTARTQFHENYILAETDHSIVIVDQHAAHERLVYERLKADLAANRIESQPLLIPEIVDLDPDDAAALLENADDYARLGLLVDGFGEGAIIVREVPALFGQGDIRALIRDLGEVNTETGGAQTLIDKLHAICAKIACYGSVRSSRRLTQPEMDALLRQMEATPNSGQCNHGRPTYVELKRGDIERLFGRR